MSTTSIQFGSSEKSRVIDDKGTVLTTHTKFHKGRGIATNRLTFREHIPTSRPTIEDLTKLLDDLFYDPDKINPSVSIESRVNDKGTVYDLVISYTVLEVE